MRGDDIVEVCKFLVREYASEKNLSTDEMKNIAADELLHWISESSVLQSSANDIVESGISPEALEAAGMIFSDPLQAAKVLTPLWPLLTIVGPPLSAKLLMSSITVTLAFEDDKVVQIDLVAPWDGTTGASAGRIFTLLQVQLTDLMRKLQEIGLDKLREDRGVDVPGVKKAFEANTLSLLRRLNSGRESADNPPESGL